MSSGLYSGVSGLALGVGLYRNVAGFWSGASGLVTGWGGTGSGPLVLDLDFLSGVLDPRITFSRASAATYFNSAGQIVYAPSNLLRYSQEFDNAAWAKVGVSSLQPNVAIAPDGSLSADKVVENSASTYHSVNQVRPAGTYIISIFAKAAERSVIQIAGATSTADYANFDLASGAVGTFGAGAVGPTIQALPGGWYRCAVQLPLNGNGPYFSMQQSASAAWLNTYAGDGASGIYIWGAQLEPQATVSSYMPTAADPYYGPRFDHFPDTLLPRGLLLEDARTNLLLNSLITGANLSTQSVTVTAQQYTLSFYGTGQIVLSGAASATVVGSGAFPSRQVVTFTPSAGSLTLTVTGTVQYAQLEAGNSASSFIPTAGTATTRAADSAAMVGSGFSSWYTPAAGTIVLGAETAFTSVANKPSALLFQSPGSDFQALSVNGGSRSITYDVGASDFLLDFISQSYSSMALPLLQASLVSDFADPYYVYGQAAAYQTGNFANSGNGTEPSVDGTGSVPEGINSLVFGPNDNALGYGGWLGWLRSVTVYGSRLPDATLASLSAIAGASPASLRLRFLTGQYYSGDTPFQTPLSLSFDFLSGLYVVDDLL